MSQYLNFYIKNNKEDYTYLIDFKYDGLNLIVEALEDKVVSYTTIKPITNSILDDGIKYLENEINNYLDLININKKIIDDLPKNIKDIDEIIDKIGELEDTNLRHEQSIDEVKKAIHYLEMLQNINGGVCGDEIRLYGGIESYPPKEKDV